MPPRASIPAHRRKPSSVVLRLRTRIRYHRHPPPERYRGSRSFSAGSCRATLPGPLPRSITRATLPPTVLQPRDQMATLATPLLGAARRQPPRRARRRGHDNAAPPLTPCHQCAGSARAPTERGEPRTDHSRNMSTRLAALRGSPVTAWPCCAPRRRGLRIVRRLATPGAAAASVADRSDSGAPPASACSLWRDRVAAAPAPVAPVRLRGSEPSSRTPPQPSAAGGVKPPVRAVLRHHALHVRSPCRRFPPPPSDAVVRIPRQSWLRPALTVQAVSGPQSVVAFSGGSCSRGSDLYARPASAADRAAAPPTSDIGAHARQQPSPRRLWPALIPRSRCPALWCRAPDAAEPVRPPPSPAAGCRSLPSLRQLGRASPTGGVNTPPQASWQHFWPRRSSPSNPAAANGNLPSSPGLPPTVHRLLLLKALISRSST